MTQDERLSILKILRPIPDPVIVELGAYHGEDFEGLLGKEMKHVMIEPDPENYDRIRRFGRRRLIRCAIGAVNGIRRFHRSSGDHGSGSLLRPTGHLKHFPQITFDNSLNVPVCTLDALFSGEMILHADLLWVDIQGAEAEMIRGGSYALSRTRYLFMEAEEVEFYEGQVLRPELLKMLPDWTLVETFDYNVLLRNEKFAA